MEELFKSLSESVSEECFKDIIGIVEEYIHEVSVGYVKQKAQNSIPSRAKQLQDNEDGYQTFTGKLSPKLQKQLDSEHEKQNNSLSDRLARAKYLANNLADSKKSANKVFKAANKVSDKRSEESDNELEKRNDTFDEYRDKDYEKVVKAFGSSRVAHARDRHAQILANKPATGSDGSKVTGNYDQGGEDDLISPQKRKQTIEKNVQKAKKDYENARQAAIGAKISTGYNSSHRDNLDQAASNLRTAEHEKKLFTRTPSKK